MITILYTIGSFESGGAERSLLKLCQNNDKSKFQYIVFPFFCKGELLSQFLKTDSIIIQNLSVGPIFGAKWPFVNRLISILNFLLYSLRYIFVINSRDINIVHFFLPQSYVIGGLLSFLTFKNIVRIMSRRSLNLYQKKKFYFAPVEKFLHPHMHFVCGNSRRVIDDLVSEGVSDSQIKLIYNGIDSEAPAYASASKLNRSDIDIDKQSLVITMVANLIPYKGHSDALKALKLFSDAYNYSWCFLVVGRDSGIQKQLEKEVLELNLHDNVKFLGSRSDIFDIYQLSNIAILTSHEEGFSNAILEAMVSRLPLVVTDVGGNSEAVAHNQNGFVVPPSDINAIAKYIYKLAMSSSLREKMGNSSYQRANNLFSLNNFIDMHHEMYYSAVDIECISRKTP